MVSGGVVGGLVGATLGSAAAGALLSDFVAAVVVGGSALGLVTGAVVGATLLVPSSAHPSPRRPLPPLVEDVLPLETVAAAFPDQFYRPHRRAAPSGVPPPLMVVCPPP